MGADEMANEGTFRPIKLVLPPAKLLSADPTAPMGNYPTPFPTVIDAVIKALEKALPERVPAGISAPIPACASTAGGDTGALFDTHDSGHGGWGACATHDGAGPFRTMAHGDTRIIPLELQESLMPSASTSSAARGFGGRRQVSRRLRLPKKIPDTQPLRSAGNVRSGQISALGRSRRQERQVRSNHGRKAIGLQGNCL